HDAGAGLEVNAVVDDGGQGESTQSGEHGRDSLSDIAQSAQHRRCYFCPMPYSDDGSVNHADYAPATTVDEFRDRLAQVHRRIEAAAQRADKNSTVYAVR